jgi:hypothetical protein
MSYSLRCRQPSFAFGKALFSTLLIGDIRRVDCKPVYGRVFEEIHRDYLQN